MRNSGAVLSPSELNALRRVSYGLANHLPAAHQDVLLTMGLINRTFGGRLVVTEAGRQRLIADGAVIKPKDDAQARRRRSLG